MYIYHYKVKLLKERQIAIVTLLFCKATESLEDAEIAPYKESLYPNCMSRTPCQIEELLK